MIMSALVTVPEETYKNQDSHPPIDICWIPPSLVLTSYFRIKLLPSVSFFSLKVKDKLPKLPIFTKMFKKNRRGRF
jgi:hypothetical protein